ncbi:MAG: hypothetical protein QM775_12420 [Pirellulales bacterium]
MWLLEIDFDAELDGQQLDGFGVELRVDVAGDAQLQELHATLAAARTPSASEKLRTVQGISTTTFPLRGAAVLAPVPLSCGLLDVMQPLRRRHVFFEAGQRR